MNYKKQLSAGLFLAVLALGTVFGGAALAETGESDKQKWKKKTGPSAGCYIETDKGVVLGINNWKKQLQLPGGSIDEGETPQVAAARETQEETMLAVTVGDLLREIPTEKGLFSLFECHASQPLDYTQLKQTKTKEVSSVLVVNPDKMTDHAGAAVKHKWRYPGDEKMLQGFFPRMK